MERTFGHDPSLGLVLLLDPVLIRTQGSRSGSRGADRGGSVGIHREGS